MVRLTMTRSNENVNPADAGKTNSLKLSMAVWTSAGAQIVPRPVS